LKLNKLHHIGGEGNSSHTQAAAPFFPHIAYPLSGSSQGLQGGVQMTFNKLWCGGLLVKLIQVWKKLVLSNIGVQDSSVLGLGDGEGTGK